MIEKYFRIFRNIFILVKLLSVAKPNNFKAISDLHLQRLEHQKLKKNIDNLVLAQNDFHGSTYLGSDDEYSIFSQHGEDGITLKILNSLRLNSGFYVEFGSGGYSSNTQILAHLGWSGLCIDGDQTDLNLAKLFFKQRNLPSANVNFVKSWITVENINSIVRNSTDKEIDLVSIDLDGMDYWLLKELKIAPKIIILEYNASLGDELSVSVPYGPNFDRWDRKYSSRGWYYGASLAAYDKLMQQKGYKLVYCESSGVNAFYVQSKFLKECKLQEKDYAQAFNGDKARLADYSQSEQVNYLKSYPWDEI